MKSIKVKATKQVTINYNIENVITNNGRFTFDNITYEYDCHDKTQAIFLWKDEKPITILFLNRNDMIKLTYRDLTEYCKCNRNFEYNIWKFRKLTQKGGDKQ